MGIPKSSLVASAIKLPRYRYLDAFRVGDNPHPGLPVKHQMEDNVERLHSVWNVSETTESSLHHIDRRHPPQVVSVVAQVSKSAFTAIDHITNIFPGVFSNVLGQIQLPNPIKLIHFHAEDLNDIVDVSFILYDGLL